MATSALKIPILFSQRLCLKPLAMEYSQGMYQMWRQQEVQKYSGVAKDINGHQIVLPARQPEDSNKLIQFWIQAANDGWGFRWAVLSINTRNQFIGHIGFNQLGDCAEIAYHMNPEYWGHGYMQEAAVQALEWSKSQGTKEVEAYVSPENLRSIRLTESLGFLPTEVYEEGARRYRRDL